MIFLFNPSEGKIEAFEIFCGVNDVSSFLDLQCKQQELFQYFAHIGLCINMQLSHAMWPF